MDDLKVYAKDEKELENTFGSDKELFRTKSRMKFGLEKCGSD